MPCASELQLPQLALDEPCELRPESAKSSTESVKASGARRPAKPSILSSDMSVFSIDDVESTFSSLLRSVAEREEGCEEVRSVDEGQVLLEEPQELLSVRATLLLAIRREARMSLRTHQLAAIWLVPILHLHPAQNPYLPFSMKAMIL